MSYAWCALRTVAADRRYLAAMGTVVLAVAALLAWGTQAVSLFPTGGLYLDPNPLKLAALLLVSALLALLAPLQFYVWQRFRASARTQGLGALGALLGVGAMSCCAPLLLPSLLATVGFSGTSLLALNLRLHLWSGPLLAASLAGLLLSLGLTLRGAARACGCLPDPDCAVDLRQRG